MKYQCPDQKKNSKDQKKTPESLKSETKAATASIVEVMPDDEGAWAAELVEVRSNNDWFKEVVAEELLKEKNIEEEIVVDEMVTEELGDISGEAFVVAESVQTLAKAKLYNSRCTNHISPYKSHFNNFEPIKTCHFRTANKQMFSTIGKGELVVNIPSDSSTTQLRLKDVLYSPEVAYTLVSIGRLDEEGFFVIFGGGKCTIWDKNQELVGVIPKTATRVYKVKHEEVANEAEERLTLGCFHCCMGHVSPETTWKLIKDKMVTGVRLEYTPYGRPFFCMSCVYAKATQKPIPKIREGERADVFGGRYILMSAGASRVKRRQKILHYLH